MPEIAYKKMLLYLDSFIYLWDGCLLIGHIKIYVEMGLIKIKLVR